jgi:glyoxylase-like metal-dependent hydrolase (beta-lactamase superfamily II)
MADHIKPQKAPPLNLPKGSEICELSIINTTCDLTVPSWTLTEPLIKGHEWLNLPTYSFHLKHAKSGKQILFDLGSRKDWYNHPPSVVPVLDSHVPGNRVKKEIIEILGEGGIDIKDIDAFVLSHWHFDHCGDPATLPRSIDMIVGPKFKSIFLPGYPTVKDSPFHEAAFEGRMVTEIEFSDQLRIGEFQAHDYFGDGSFYILNVPGHAVGHISGIVRTTLDTFVFLGGDVCHFGGSFRPTKYIPMPSVIPPETKLDARIKTPCPCSAFTICHPDQQNARTSPFYQATTAEGSWYTDPPTAQNSINSLEAFDAHDDVLVAIAHDPAAMDVFTFFPNGTMNDWQRKKWKTACQWGFVNEMPYQGKPGRPYLADGLYKDGKMIKAIDSMTGTRH